MKMKSALAWAIVALAGSGSMAAAEEIPEEEAPAIVVEVPRERAIETERSPYTGAAVMVSTMRIPVRYGDLDLKREADVERLMVRIDRVAHDACMQLDVLYPLDRDPDCIRRASANGRKAAEAMLAGQASE